VFVGRDNELAIARELLERIAAGDAAQLLIAGEAGVGKTRFVEELAASAREQGARVLSGRCVQLGMDGLPFAPVAEALRELVRETGTQQLDELLGPARERRTQALRRGLVRQGQIKSRHLSTPTSSMPCPVGSYPMPASEPAAFRTRDPIRR
jgi:predicted ATPase